MIGTARQLPETSSDYVFLFSVMYYVNMLYGKAV